MDELTADEAGHGDPAVVFSETHRISALNRKLSPNVIVLFGATGDLARRKLLPGLLNLSRAGLLPDFRVVGAARRDMSDDDFREQALTACAEFGRRTSTPEQLAEFAGRLSFVNVADSDPDLLAAAVHRAEGELDPDVQRLLYLSVPPAGALNLIRLIEKAHLVDRSRIIMEKPFGTEPCQFPGTQRRDPRGVRRAADLPDRSLPG